MPTAAEGVESVSHGLGLHLGLLVRWRLVSRGLSFREDVSSLREGLPAGEEGVAAACGYDATSDQLWETDSAGAGTLLEGDDREARGCGCAGRTPFPTHVRVRRWWAQALLLVVWARTGAWLHPAAGGHLEVAPWAGPVPAAEAADGLDGDLEALWPSRLWPPALRLRVALRGGALGATLLACPATGAARLLRLHVAGDREGWVFGPPAAAAPPAGGCGSPGVVVHAAASGARNVYRADGAVLSAVPPGCAPLALGPPAGCLGGLAGGVFDAAAPRAVPVERTRSGHTLVALTLNGSHAGLAILDTGASGLVVSRACADAFALPAFGTVHVSGAGDRVPARWRRAASARVGPLTLARPLLLEMETDGLVWGASAPCVGIVGWDLFRRAVVDFPPAPAPHVFVHPPWHALDGGTGGGGPPLPWLACVLAANVPHVWARWHGCGGDGGAALLLMLDTGAGGADAIFHARTVARLGMASVGAFGGTTLLRGVTASGGPGGAQRAGGGGAPAPSLSTQRRTLDYLELLPSEGAQPGDPGCVRFEPVDALLLAADGLFDLSASSACARGLAG